MTRSGLLAVLLVRHASPRVVPDQAPAEWTLSTDGADGARFLGAVLRETLAPSPAAVVVASTERKAIETARCLGLGDVHTDSRIAEVRRPWHDDSESFQRAAQTYLSGDIVPGWESIEEARARFDELVAELAPRPAVLVSHGTVMSAWLGGRVRAFDSAGFWQQLRMPDAWFVDLDAWTVDRVEGDAGSASSAP